MELTNRNIHRGSWAYCQITTLAFDNELKNENSLIEEVIRSKWFLWQGEKYPNGMTWHKQEKSGKNKAFPGIRMHGCYDANLIEPGDFQLISEKRFLEALLHESRLKMT